MSPINRILAVDDNPVNLAIIEESLQGRFDLRTATSGEEALWLMSTYRPDVVLLDIMMPAPDGFEVCSRIKNDRKYEATQVVMVSAKADINSRLRGYQVGADDYIVNPFNEEELYAKVCANLRSRTVCRAVREEIEELCGAAGDALTLASQLRDVENAGHLTRMRDYAQILATDLRRDTYRDLIDEEFLDALYRASPLHDIGKIGVPDVILRKPGALTPAEFAVMQQHTCIGERILGRLAAQMSRPYTFAMASQIARSHHESFDGSGYPDGLCSDSIPLAARIVKVADVFDAITSARVYKRKQSPRETRDWMISNKGTQFDPLIIDAFERAYADFASLADESQADECDCF